MNVLGRSQGTHVGHLEAYQVDGDYHFHAGQVRAEDKTLFELLQPIEDASHTRDRRRSPPDSVCTRGTRLEVVRKVTTWTGSDISDADEPHILWMHGYVGCGKSAISQEVCQKSQSQGRPVASFFFFRNAGDRSKIWRLAPTLANQMAAGVPEMTPFVRAAVTANPGLKNFPATRTSVAMQMQGLVYGPFKAAAERRAMTTLGGRPFLIVIDGLDECDDKEEVQELIESMLTFFEDNPFIPLRVFITSRVEEHIQSHLDVPGVRLENLADHCSDDDIDTFLSVLFEDARRRNRIIRAYAREHGEWPIPSDQRKLVKHIDGSFIFASTVFKFIMGSNDRGSQPMTPMDRLPLALKMNPGLDSLYAQTLARSEHLPYFLDIISTIALLEEPLPTSGIAELLGISTYEVVNVLVNLQAVIQVPGTDDIPVTLCHTSLRDFLSSERSGRFFAHPSHHVRLLLRCFECELEFRRSKPGSFIDSAELRPVTAYALDYYQDHLYFGERFFKPPDLDRAIQLRREALQLSPYTPDSTVIDALVDSLWSRYMHTNSPMDLEEASALSREALRLTPSTHPNYGELVASAADPLRGLYWRVGNVANLEEAIVLYRGALSLPHSRRTQRLLDGLGSALLDRYHHTGTVADLTEAVALYRETPFDPWNISYRSLSKLGLGISLLYCFQCTGTTADLEEAISLLRESVVLHPLHDPSRSLSLAGLGNALRERHQHTGNLADLEETIILLREALEARPSPHPDRAGGLSLLGNAVLDRHRCTKNTADLDEASSLLREAVRLQPLLYPERPISLNGLGNALLDQYRCTGFMADLEEAISCFREALGLRPLPHPYRSSSLHGLGDVLLEHYWRSGTVADLKEAIASYRESMSLYPAHRREYPTVRASLSRSLQLLYEQTRTSSHLHEAITLREELLAFYYPEGHQDRVACLDDLASLLEMRFDVTGQEEDLAYIAGLKDEATRLSTSTYTT